MQNLRSPLEDQGLIAAPLRIIAGFKNIIFGGLLIEVVLNCINIITAYDFPWQLTEGHFILNHGYVAQSVLQAYGEISPHFANEYILYEICLAIVHIFTGWTGLYIFFGLLSFLIYAPCLLAFYNSRGRWPFILVFSFLYAQYIINYRISARPELIADICFMAIAAMLLRHETRQWSNTKLIGLASLFCLWANVHASFLLGLIMLVFWYAQAFLFQWRLLFLTKDFTWIRPGFAALLGCSLNPFGINRFLQPFQLHGLLWGQAISPEMWPATGPATADTSPTWTSLFCILIILFILLTRLRRRSTLWVIALLFLLQQLTFSSNRYELFIGLILLTVICEALENNLSDQRTSSPLFVHGQIVFCFLFTLCFGFFITCLFNAKFESIRINHRAFYRDTLVATNSSFEWLRSHPKDSYYLLSSFDVGSWSQLPDNNGIHPLFDSGTHRYSDRVNQFYYYCLYSPTSLRFAISQLQANSIILDNNNIDWAPILNADPHWTLAQIEPDSQLYLRKNLPDIEIERKLLGQWEDPAQSKITNPNGYLFHDFMRGLNLRSNQDSLRMLESLSDTFWMFDTHITFLRDWLNQVPDNLVQATLKSIGNKADDQSVGLRILLLLRLGQYQQASDIANKWTPFILAIGYQNMQELRAEAYLAAGKDETARRILESFWPKPGYSLRWARLCQQAYAHDPQNMPRNARLLVEKGDDFTWQRNLISTLNQNIERISTSTP